MLVNPNTTRIYLCLGSTDMRKGFDGLFALVSDRMQLDPLTGHLFAFCNRDRTRIKVLYWDGSGLWICAKRLEKGCFAWPENHVEGKSPEIPCLSAAQWTLLVEGIDLRQTKERRWLRIKK